MKAETIIITGGHGFVGRYLVDELRRPPATVQIIIWDKEMRPTPPGVRALTVDITQPDSYRQSLEDYQPAWIVHLAAMAPVGESFKHPELTHQVNVVATQQLLATAARLSPRTQFLVTSSADIYGQGSATPLAELPLTAAHPRNPYGQSKWEMEKIIEAEFNDRVIRVRPFPHIGPGQQPGFVTADFASQIAAIEAKQQDGILRVGRLAAVRDFTDVRDVVRAYRLLLTKGKPGEVYHVASGVAVSIQNILDHLLTLTTVPIKVAEDSARLRPVDIPVLVGDATKLRQATGWQPVIPLAQSLRDILEYWRRQYRSNS